MSQKKVVSEDYKLLLRQIGRNLAKERQAQGLSQRQLGALKGKNSSMIAKVEKFASSEITLRNVYEVAQLLPVSLGEVILKSERELDLHRASCQPTKVDDRLSLLVERFGDLTEAEQWWLADMIEGLLSRTSAPAKLTDSVDSVAQRAGAVSNGEIHAKT